MQQFNEIVQVKPNEELLKMVYEFDQWAPEMLQATEGELSKRGILPADVRERKQKLMALEEYALSNGKEADLFGQVIGWLTVFGLLGAVIGYNYAFTKVGS